MKNIYDLFNNIDVDLREYEEIKIHDNEVEDIKNRISNKLNKDNKRNKKAYKPIAATIAGLLLVTAVFNTDTVSASIDKIAKTIKAHFIEKIGRDFSDYTVNVGETIEDKDISVTLNEFIIDNSLIIVNHTIDYSKLDKELRDKVDYDIKIKVNGKIW
jgi:type III secretory pathway component EscV